MAQHPAPDTQEVIIWKPVSEETAITRNTVLTRDAPERALLLAVTAKGHREKKPARDSIEELAQLAGAAGANVVGKIIQQLPAPSTTYYVGRGKLQELIALRDSADYNVLILDDELSPNQQRNLEEALKVKTVGEAVDFFAELLAE